MPTSRCTFLVLSSLALTSHGVRITSSSSSDPSFMSTSTCGSTALDFQELLRREREKCLEEVERAKDCSATPAAPAILSPRHSIALDDHAVGGVEGLYYIPGFLSKEEGRRLEEETYGSYHQSARSGWINLHKRRLQVHGGIPHPDGMVPEKLPQFLQEGGLVGVSESLLMLNSYFCGPQGTKLR
ncbi:unnamed protein product [Choristocarpus tenellus]